LRCGNTTNAGILALIRANEVEIQLFLRDVKAGLLEIY